VYGTGFPAVGSPCSVTNANQKLAASKGAGSSAPALNQQARLLLNELNPTQGNYYSGGNGGSILESNSAYGNYHGVVVTMQHRFSTTFNLVTNYTWSHCLNNADPQGDISGTNFSNPNIPSLDYGRCGSDIRHNLNIYGVFKSKFALHGIAASLVNNWEFSPLIRLVSGTPFTVGENLDESLTGNGGDRPNIVPGVPLYNYNRASIRSDTQPGTTQNYGDRGYLNQNAFSENIVPGTQGNEQRNMFSNPNYFQNDAEISRLFPIHERLNLDLRIEAYNVLNRPSFNAGNTNPSVSNSVATFNQSGSNFGEITGTSVGGRVFQGAIKVLF
jgi:hypothetical protein